MSVCQYIVSDPTVLCVQESKFPRGTYETEAPPEPPAPPQPLRECEHEPVCVCIYLYI